MRWLAAHAGPFQAVTLLTAIILLVVSFFTGLHDGLWLTGLMSGVAFVWLCDIERDTRPTG